MILLIEDDPGIRVSLQELLELEGFEVTMTAHGQYALDYLVSAPTHPRLILLDMMMPVMDGPAFINAYRKTYPSSKTPIIAFTAVGSKEKIEGITTRLSKPVDADELLETIRKSLES